MSECLTEWKGSPTFFFCFKPHWSRWSDTFFKCSICKCVVIVCFGCCSLNFAGRHCRFPHLWLQMTYAHLTYSQMQLVCLLALIRGLTAITKADILLWVSSYILTLVKHAAWFPNFAMFFLLLWWKSLSPLSLSPSYSPLLQDMTDYNETTVSQSRAQSMAVIFIVNCMLSRTIHPSAPHRFCFYSFILLILNWMGEWKDVSAVNGISLFSHLCSFFPICLSLSLFLLCCSTLLFCNPLITLWGCFSFYLEAPVSILLSSHRVCVCVFPCIHKYSSTCDVYLYMCMSHIAVCVHFNSEMQQVCLNMQRANLSLSLSVFLPLLELSGGSVHWLHTLFMSLQWIISMHGRECWDSSGCFTFPVLFTLFSHTFFPSLSLFPHLLSLLWHFVPPYW